MDIDQIRRFKCPRCHYEASVYGETIESFGSIIETVVCTDCKEVIEVLRREVREKEDLESKNDSPFPDFEQAEVEPFCLKCERKNLISWNKECPKCENFMFLSHLDWRIWGEINQTVNIIGAE